MACFSCGSTFNGDEMERVRRYKRFYDEKGLVSYYYKTESKGRIKVVRGDGFSTIFETVIKPNFINGAEYAHISEFT